VHTEYICSQLLCVCCLKLLIAVWFATLFVECGHCTLYLYFDVLGYKVLWKIITHVAWVWMLPTVNMLMDIRSNYNLYWMIYDTHHSKMYIMLFIHITKFVDCIHIWILSIMCMLKLYLLNDLLYTQHGNMDALCYLCVVLQNIQTNFTKQ
jgi:hypothetical protein